MRTKKLWNQIVSILLVIALLPVSALAELRPEDTAHPDVVNQPEFTVSVSHVNPEYERLGVRFPRPTADCMTMAESTVDSLDDAAEYLREQMEDRVTQVTISLGNYTFVDGTQMQADWKTILYGALAHTGVSTQGDYIVRHYGKSEGQIGYDGISTATFVYNIVYDTTLEQENTVGERIDELFTAWDAECGFYDLSDYEQVKVIYDYICENVVYDYDNLLNLNYTLKYSAYAALINGTAVCQGYANLFYRMALEAGIDTRIIVGDGGGPHSWNIVELGEKYYYLDATWDAPLAEKDYPYEYFLLGSDNFCVDHTPEADNVLDCDVTTYPIDTADYVPTVEQDTLIEEATEAGLLLYFDTIAIEESLTRLNAAKLIAALAELELDSTATLPFEDCAGLTEEEQQIIATVCQAGLMTGYDATTFQPANTLTRAMVALILYRAMNGGVDDEDIWDYADDGLFSDIGNSKWYTPYVNYLASIGVIPTSEDGKFYPNDTAILRPVLRWAVNATNLASEEPELPEIPEDIIASGECGKDGDNLTWTLTEDGTLTISGEGEMQNYFSINNQPWSENRYTITDIIICEGVTSIGYRAFSNCDSLANVTISNSVTSIGERAFRHCVSLASITIPDGVTSIGYLAFSFCTSLTSITIPNSVAFIDNEAFSSCSSLTAIFVSSDNPNYCAVDGVLFNKNMDVLITYPMKKVGNIYKIPDEVTTIGNSALSYCLNLTSITIPDSVTTIGDYAFDGCTVLKTVYFTGTEAQWNNIAIGENNAPLLDAEILFVDDGEAPELPDGAIAAGKCGENLTWTLTEDGTLTISGEGAMEDYLDWQDMPWYSYRTQITGVKISEGITSIGDCAFWYCANLANVTIPDSVVTISNNAFRDCTSLASITLPNNVIAIGDNAFYSCINLTGIIIPDSVTEMGTSVFASCTALTNVTIGKGMTYIEMDSFGDCTSLANIIIPDGVTYIGGSAFHDCTSLTSITIPVSVAGIDFYAFDGCNALTTVYYAGTEEQWNTIFIYPGNDPLLDAEIIFEEDSVHTHTEEIIPGYDATCTDDGLTDGVQCSICGEILVAQEVIPAKGHTEEVIHGYDATCTTDGLTDGTKCSVCGEVLVAQEIIPAKGHTEEVISGYDATCTEDGLTDGVKCSVCGVILVAQEIIPALGHEFDEGVVTTEPTCTESGIKTYICLREGCDHSFTESIPSTGHIDENGDYICDNCGENLCTEHIEEIIHGYDATCTDDGLTDGVQCSICGEILVAQEVIPAKGHTEEAIHGYDATCTEDGLTDGVKCATCGTILVEQEVIPAKGHTEEVIHGYDATCTEDGLTDGTMCSTCGEILVAQEIIPAKGHTEEVIPGYPATLTAPGLTDGIKCSVCGEILVAQEEIPALTEISGTCGENLTWTLTSEGVLTISGKGAMYNFTIILDLLPLSVVPMNEETAVPAPWSEYATLITNVVVADGVTSIGDNAFAACENLKEIEIPETVTAIGDNVFTGCEALETITYTGSEEQWDEITLGEGNETLEDAEVVIRNFMLGDINLDGVRDEDDLYALFRHCRMIEVRTVILEVFDINGDGEFDDLDLNALFRHYRLIESQW